MPFVKIYAAAGLCAKNALAQQQRVMWAVSSSASVSDICEWFFAVEREHHLFSREEQGCYFWRGMRMSVYYALTESLELFGKAHPEQAANTQQVWNRRWRLLRDAILRNPHLSLRRSDYVLMPHSRLVAGKDIYSDALAQYLPASNCLTISRYGQPHAPKGSQNLAGAVLWQGLKRRLKSRAWLLSAETQKLLHDVQDNMQARFGCHIDLLTIAEQHIRPFMPTVHIYESLFRKRQAKVLYIVVGYANLHCAAIKAAHRCGMKVVELQHGTFTPYHLGYSFPDAEAPVPYSPDELWCFGAFWPEHTQLPPQTRTRIIGAPYVEELAEKHAATARDEDMIVFTSQGVIGAPLCDFAVECARGLPDKQIVFRLHPSENLAVYEQRLAKLANVPQNFALSHRTPNIFALLAQCGVQAGVFSTTLFEGMVLGCKTVVIDMPGVEYMRPVIAEGDALFVRSAEEFCQRLADAPTCQNPQYYYADAVTDFSGF